MCPLFTFYCNAIYSIKLVPRRNQKWDSIATCLVIKKMAESSNEDQICVLVCLETPNSACNWPLNFKFSGRKALALAIRSHSCVAYKLINFYLIVHIFVWYMSKYCEFLLWLNFSVDLDGEIHKVRWGYSNRNLQSYTYYLWFAMNPLTLPTNF